MNELMHYGVPGMRWGHRKAGIVSTQKSKTPLGSIDFNPNINSKPPKGIVYTQNTGKSSTKGAAHAKKRTKGAITSSIKKGARAVASTLIGLSTLSLADDMFYGGAGKKLLAAGANFVASKIKNTFDGGINIPGGGRFYQGY